MTPSPALQQKFMQAFAFHRAGQFAAAEPLYKDVLKASAKHFDALHMLGVLCLQTGRNDEALRLIKKATAVDPTAHAAQNNLGNALQAVGRYQEALESYDQALALKPDYAEAIKNRGDALQAMNRHDEALASYEKAVAISPGHAEAHNNRGVSLLVLGRYAEALESYDRAVAVSAHYSIAISNRGDALRMLGRHEDALTSYRHAVALEPGFTEAMASCGNMLRVLRRYDEALATYDRVLALAPNHLKAMNNRGAVLRDLRRYPEALQAFDRALGLKPDYVEALVNRGTTLHEMGHDGDAVAAFDQALAINPHHPEAHWHKSLALLSRGDVKQGWPEYEWRWKTGEFKFPPRNFMQPQWRGEDLRGGALLVWGEQGLGDEIFYGGMVDTLINRGVPVFWEADKRLLPLIKRTYPSVKAFVRTTPPDAMAADPAIKAQISTASLGQHLRSDPGDFPSGRRKYLQADAARGAAYRTQILGAKTRLIGVSWISKNPDFGAHKTTRLDAWVPIWQAAGAESCFVDLQYGDTAAERGAVPMPLAHVDGLDLHDDIDGLAALIAACDLVVTVSNTTAHLAGALGVPTWVMVPGGNGKLWYWAASQTHTPWYPAVKVFRQNAIGAWDDVIAQVAREIAKPE